jgi:thioredoxin 2
VLRRCPTCGRENRIPLRHLAHVGRCGECKQQLAPLAHPIEVDAPTFDEIVTQSPVPVLVDFWAPWCGPCRSVAPEVAKAAQLLAGKAVVLKLDTDRHPEVAARFNVQGIPNFVVLSNGRRVAQQAGAMGHQRLLALVAQAAGSPDRRGWSAER